MGLALSVEGGAEAVDKERWFYTDQPFLLKDKEEEILRRLQHFYDYMNWYVGLFAAGYYATFLLVGFLTRFMYVEWRRRV